MGEGKREKHTSSYQFILILWEGETRWTEIGMHQLVQPEEVTYSHSNTTRVLLYKYGNSTVSNHPVVLLVVICIQVRKYYKKACLVAHPDKVSYHHWVSSLLTCAVILQLVGLPHENLARQIFIALNEAHTIFEESGGQPLL